MSTLHHEHWLLQAQLYRASLLILTWTLKGIEVGVEDGVVWLAPSELVSVEDLFTACELQPSIETVLAIQKAAKR